MARAQTLKKKGRNSSSAKPAKGRKTAGRPAARRNRPTEKGMVGSKGKGRRSDRRGEESDGDDGHQTWTGAETGIKPDGSRTARASTRGPEPNAGGEGREARARRAGLGFRDDE